KELGFLSRRTKVPASTRRSVSRFHSSCDPSHQTTWSGVVSSATSRTHARRRPCLLGAWARPGQDVAAIATCLLTGRHSPDSPPTGVPAGFFREYFTRLTSEPRAEGDIPRLTAAACGNGDQHCFFSHRNDKGID